MELREGQYLAIAGLMDNETTRNLTKIPLLGDIPILGELFKSRGIRDRRTELLVLVTPELVQATEVAPQVPTGEPGPPPPPGRLEARRLSEEPTEIVVEPVAGIIHAAAEVGGPRSGRMRTVGSRLGNERGSVVVMFATRSS